MLSPIVQYHGASFMTAIGIVWGEKRKRSKLNQEHKVIIEIIKSLKICTIPVILTNIIDILKLASSNNNKDKKKTNLNIVWLLQFLHAYLESYSQSVKKRTPDTADSIKETINALCNFFKEFLSSSITSNLVPACFFQLFRFDIIYILY
jgi:ABC-type transport system involved in cytochrome bd biosynthesis fused ATPase/permease subunit